MNWKDFLKPELRRIGVTIILFLILPMFHIFPPLLLNPMTQPFTYVQLLGGLNIILPPYTEWSHYNPFQDLNLFLIAPYPDKFTDMTLYNFYGGGIFTFVISKYSYPFSLNPIFYIVTNLIFILISIAISYFLSCLIIWIYDKFRKGRKK